MTSCRFDSLMERLYPSDPLMAELKSVAFDVLLQNSGSEFSDWRDSLIRDYTETVTEALGGNPEEVYASLADLWESEYNDPATGLCLDFSEWASAFATDEAVMIYRELAEERSKDKE